MKLYHNIQSVLIKKCHSVVTIGMFDSLHLGHQSVLAKVVDISKEKNIESVVITFSNAPSTFFNQNSRNDFIFPVNDKIEQIRKFDIDHLVILPFDSFLASLNAKQFIEEILLNQLNISDLVLGYDNHFGKGREGSVDFINNNYSSQITAFSVNAVELNQQIISSTLIKTSLSQGNVFDLKSYLGRNYYLEGKIVKGKQLGRQLGFKTANIQFSNDLYVPAFGVYAVRIVLDKQTFIGVTNLGIRPTILDDNLINVETHILDFDEEIYGKIIKIEFIDRIRNEIKFNSLDELKMQISNDINQARKILA